MLTRFPTEITCSSSSAKRLGLWSGLDLILGKNERKERIFPTRQSLVPSLGVGPRCLRDQLGENPRGAHPGNSYLPRLSGSARSPEVPGGSVEAPSEYRLGSAMLPPALLVELLIRLKHSQPAQSPSPRHRDSRQSASWGFIVLFEDGSKLLPAPLTAAAPEDYVPGTISRCRCRCFSAPVLFFDSQETIPARSWA